MPSSSSAAEGPERRAELTQAVQEETGLDEAVLEHLVREFYAQARLDPLLGPVFARVSDWDAHIEKICAFWSSVALMTGRYHGQPMAAHLPLELEPEHFQRWLALFEATARSCCTPQAVALLMAKANRIAQSLTFGIAAQRGVLPARGSSTATAR